jgi:F1F0 ATPase subunit 2
MREVLLVVLALLGGILLGIIFFGGLWWTVQRGVSSKQPAVWFFASLMLRTAIVVVGFYFVMHGDWRRVVASLLGFILARLCIVRLTSPEFGKRNQMTQGGAA